MKLILWIMVATLSFSLHGRAESDEEDVDAEIEAASPAAEKIQPLQQEYATEAPTQRKEIKRTRSLLELETERQNQILQRKRRSEEPVSADRNVNRFPTKEPLFKLPPGPKEGGTVRLEHPRAAEGLLKINKDGSYQYKTMVGDKSQSGTLKISSLTPPVISASGSNITYKSMYGNTDLLMLQFDYEWQPFRRFGSLGLQFGSGMTTATAKGTFKLASPARPERSEESYNLFIVPISTFLVYRFEFVKRQWVVPFISGGATYYGMAEIRDDGKAPKFAGAPAVGGGGGALFSISRLDSAGTFTLSQEYGVADMWLVVEARAMQGLYSDIDFTNQSVNAGIAVDF